MRRFLGALFCIPLIAVGCYRGYRSIVFDINCSGHMKRAADANSIELAGVEMAQVVKYLEENRMTSGYTSVLYNTPDEDVGFFYNNMASALDGLDRLDPHATELEKSNILIKLRETLLDVSESRVKTTVPDGISVFPNNFGLACLMLCSVFLAFVGCHLAFNR